MIRRLSLLLLLLLCLAAFSGTCSAKDYTMTEEQMQRSFQLLSDLKKEIAILKLNSNDSAIQLTEVSQKLEIAEKKLKTAEDLLGKSQNETKEALKLVEELRLDVANLKISYEKYKQEKESQIRSLERQNTILKIITSAAIFWAATK